MTRFEIEQEHWLERYLAGRLSPADVQRFEAYWIEHPEITDELERCARLKSGLVQLQATGALEPLLRRGWWSGRLRLMALAASIACVALSVLLWSSMRQAPDVAQPLRIARLASALPPLGDAALQSAGRVSIMRLRSSASRAAIVELPASPRALLLRVMPDVDVVDFENPADADASRFAVALSRLEARGAQPDPALRSDADLLLDSEGYVAFYVDSRALRPGRYELRLQRTDRALASKPRIESRFILEVRGSEAGAAS